MENRKLAVGDKYLSIQLFGKNGVRIAAFENKERKGNEPHFRGDGVAVWVTKKKSDAEKKDSEDVL